MVMKRLFSYILTIGTLICNAQSVILESRIVDKKGEPIPFVHIYHDQTRSGTISNLQGFFILNISVDDINSLLSISSIGYETQRLTIAEVARKHQIVLSESMRELAAVTITPRNYALELLEKTIDQIPENYPSQREMNTGFTRELIYWEGAKDEPIYIAEAAMESIKEDYQKPQSKRGDVRVMQGRKFESSQLDTLGIRFYGGLFDPFTMDDVYSRSHILNKKNLKKYEFTISDTLRFEGKSLFVLEFKPNKEALPKGTLYIMDSTFAVVKTNFYFNREAAKDFLDGLGGYQRQFQERETEYYISADKKWRIKRAEYKSSFENQGRELHLTSSYATTGISSEFEEIPYSDKAQYRDVFLHHTGAYDPDFWKDYNVILSDRQTEELFKQQDDPQTRASEEKKKVRFIDIARRINTAFGLRVIPIDINAHGSFFTNSAITINESLLGTSSHGLELFSSMEYELRPGFYIGYETSNSFKKDEYNSMMMTIRKDFNLNTNGRPIYLSVGINSGWQKVSVDLGNFSFQNSFELGGREFDSNHVDVYVQYRSYNLNPFISLEYEHSRSWHFFVRGYLNLPVTSRTGLFFEETDQFFLKKKRKFLENGNEGVNLTTSDVFSSDWLLSLGIRFGIDL